MSYEVPDMTEFYDGFGDRANGKPMKEEYKDNRDSQYWDGWITADAEAGNCTDMCHDPEFGDDSLDEDEHKPTCGMNFKDVK